MNLKSILLNFMQKNMYKTPSRRIANMTIGVDYLAAEEKLNFIHEFPNETAYHQVNALVQ